MRIAIVLDTAGTDAEVYELEEDAPEITGAHVGTFPLPGHMVAAMLGLPPEPIDAATRDLPPAQGHNPRGSAYV